MKKKEILKITTSLSGCACDCGGSCGTENNSCGCGDSCSTSSSSCGCGGSCSGSKGSGDQFMSRFSTSRFEIAQGLRYLKIDPSEKVSVSYLDLYVMMANVMKKAVALSHSVYETPTPSAIPCVSCDAPGCCGNSNTLVLCINGCCTYVSAACLAHDLACSNCQPQWMCGSACIPTP